jgi:hypothetical protein
VPTRVIHLREALERYHWIEQRTGEESDDEVTTLSNRIATFTGRYVIPAAALLPPAAPSVMLAAPAAASASVEMSDV